MKCAGGKEIPLGHAEGSQGGRGEEERETTQGEDVSRERKGGKRRGHAQGEPAMRGEAPMSERAALTLRGVQERSHHGEGP